jgi:hypothetical protein
LQRLRVKVGSNVSGPVSLPNVATGLRPPAQASAMCCTGRISPQWLCPITSAAASDVAPVDDPFSGHRDCRSAYVDAVDGASGNQAFSFSGVAGDLRFTGGIVSGDLNGDGNADFKIGVAVPALNATDFVL